MDKKDEVLTLGKYIINPTNNKGNLVLNLNSIRNDLNLRYDKLLENKKKDFKLNVYEKKDDLFVYIKEPSESYNMTYDIVFQINKNNESIEKSPLKVFSNSPSFAYTYAYVFNNNNLLIEDLKKKYSKEFFKRLPYQRNFYEIVSIEKSLFIAINYLLDNFDSIGTIIDKAVKYDSKVFNEIKTVEEKVKEYKKLQIKEREKRNKEKLENIEKRIKDLKNNSDKNKKTTTSDNHGKKIKGTKSSHGRVKPNHRKPKITGRKSSIRK